MRVEPMTGAAFITKKELKAFKALARKEYHVELTDEEVFEQAFALANLFDHVFKMRLKEKRQERLEQRIQKQVSSSTYESQ